MGSDYTPPRFLMTLARILIVEDDEPVAQCVALLVEALGYANAGIVARGEDVLLQLSNLKPDLILMDVMLAGAMDGIETARQVHRRCDVPVVFVTAYDDADLLKRAITTGPFAYLHKPLKEGELKLTLELALYRHRMEARLRETLADLERHCNAMEDGEARFRVVFEEAPIGMAFSHPDGRFFKFNPTFCKVLGYAENELLDRDFFDITHPADWDANRALIKRAMSGEISRYRLEQNYLGKDGQIIPVNLIANLIRNREGKPAYWLTMIENAGSGKTQGSSP